MDIDKYVDTFARELKPLKKRERKRLIIEVEDKIDEGILAGKSDLDIIKELGDPVKLARQYLDEDYGGADGDGESDDEEAEAPAKRARKSQDPAAKSRSRAAKAEKRAKDAVEDDDDLEEEELLGPKPPLTFGRVLLSLGLFLVCLVTLWPLLLVGVLLLGLLFVLAMCVVACGIFILALNFVAPVWPDMIQGLNYGVAANTLMSVAFICFGLLLCILMGQVWRGGTWVLGHPWHWSQRTIFYRSDKRRRK